MNDLEAAFAHQAAGCDLLGSPLTACLLRGLLDDYRNGGASRDLLAPWEAGDPMKDAVALRLAGALHCLVLSGRAPALADYYPSAGGRFREDGLAGAATAVLHAEHAFVASFLRNTPQTNEVGRSGVLIGGFLAVAGETGLPLRCLEVGASAGLNLLWDRFRYDFGSAQWGDPASPVPVTTRWTGQAPDTGMSAVVTERMGCDLSPVDLSSPEAALRLRSYVWPDQPARFRAVDGALAQWRRTPVTVERADAGQWIRRRLAEPVSGAATVVYHSIAAQYFPPETRTMFETAIREAGSRASAAAPVAWLRLEAPDIRSYPELRLTLWPGGAERLLATAHPHGAFADWTARA
ncbi:MAG: DUF2332 family protein [Alphaproteobacteria bacterium]|nr:DUF2332 family protein [Alphaproteobacteria bacterium]